MENTVTLEKVEGKAAEQLMQLINNDVSLQDLRGGRIFASLEEFRQVGEEWCRRHDYRVYHTFAVACEGKVVGSFSVSYPQQDTRNAYIGGFLGSDHRNTDFYMVVLKQLLKFARNMGIVKVSGKKMDAIELKAWETLGAKIEQISRQYYAELNLV